MAKAYAAARRLKVGVAPLLAVMLLAYALGCATERKPAAPPLPTLRDIRSRQPTLPQPLPGTAYEPLVIAQLTRAEFSLQADLAPAWEFTSPEELQLEEAELWKRNGLRAAVLPEAKLEKFLAALPGQTLGSRRWVIQGGRELMPLSLTPGIGSPVQIKLASGAGQLQDVKYTRGSLRFLVRFDRTSNGSLIEIYPQHFQLQPSVQPRLEEQTTLDGTVYEDLLLRAKLSPKQLLVIGVQWPEPEEQDQPSPAADKPSSEGKPDNLQRSAPEKPAQSPKPGGETPPVKPKPGSDAPPVKPKPAQDKEAVKPPPQLGSLLLCTRRNTGVTQALLILRLQPK